MMNLTYLSRALTFFVILATTWTSASAVQKTFNGNVSTDWFNGDNWDPPGVPAAGDDVVLNSGTLDLSGGNATVTSYMHANGTLTGSGTLTVTGTMTWERGIIRGTGTVNAEGGIEMDALSTMSLTDTRTLTNAGVASWTGPGTFSIGGNAIFTNLGGATFEIQTAADMGSGTFNNMGTVTKEAGSGDGVTNISSFINDTGSFTVISGTLSFSGSGDHSGTVDVQAGAAFRFTGGTHEVTGSFTSTDTIGFNGGTITFEDGSTYSVGAETVVTLSNVMFEGGANVTLGQNLEIEGGTLDLSSGTDFTVMTYTHTNGTLTGSDDVTVTGLMTWERGVIRGTGTINANGGIDMDAVSTMSLTDTRTLNNAGVASWTGPGTFSIGGNATFNNLEAATFEIQTAADMGSGIFNNMGTVTKESGSGDGVTSVSSSVSNQGLVEILSGTLFFTNMYTQTAGATRLNGGSVQTSRPLEIQGGTVEGAGVITGNVAVTENGVASPGFSAGSLGVTGSYTQDDDAAYGVEIGGGDAGAFDLLDIGGSATLGGAIRATLIEDFAPTVGQSFEVMTFASRNGDFDDESGLVVGGGFGFRKTVSDTTVTLQYVQEVCDDDQDNDGDGLTDCLDAKCADVPACLASPTPTDTPTFTPTSTDTPTFTPTDTWTPSPSPTPTATPEHTNTATATPTQGSTSTPTMTPTIDCVGDCMGDRVVTVDEIIIGLSVALGTASLDECPVFDFNGDGAVTVEEIITAVRQALEGCPDLTPIPGAPRAAGLSAGRRRRAAASAGRHGRSRSKA